MSADQSAERPDQTDGSRNAQELWNQVYAELRSLAAARLAREQPGQTLQPTALVHEAWLRLNSVPGGGRWDNKGHFFAAAAESMRRILVDRARKKRGPRAGGLWKRVNFLEEVDGVLQVDHSSDEQLLAINDILEKLAGESPIKAELVKLRFFAGLDHQEAAAVLGISRATADRHWAYAKAYLYEALSDR